MNLCYGAQGFYRMIMYVGLFLFTRIVSMCCVHRDETMGIGKIFKGHFRHGYLILSVKSALWEKQPYSVIIFPL